MWSLWNSILDRSEANMCHEMAVKISGNEDIIIVFSDHDEYEEEEEVCSVDSLTERGEPHCLKRNESDRISEPSNSLELHEEIEDRRANTSKQQQQQQQQYTTSILSETTTTTTASTESEGDSSSPGSRHTTATPSQKSVYLDIDDFPEEQDQRDEEPSSNSRRHTRTKSWNEYDMDEQDYYSTTTDSSHHGKNNSNDDQGPLQRKASEETEDSDIDDSLVFDDDFVAEFDAEENEANNPFYPKNNQDDEDLVMELVDDDDIDDDETLTRLIDIHVGDMMDGSAHMEKISLHLRPSFFLGSSPSTTTTTTSQQIPSPMLPPPTNYSISNSKRRQLFLSLPQIVEQEGDDPEEQEEGESERQARLEEIKDPHLRTLLKTISRRSKCSERFDMDVLMEHFQGEDVQDPTIHSALENLSSRVCENADPNKSEIEENDLDIFFNDIRKGVIQQEQQQQQNHGDAPTMTEQKEPTSSSSMDEGENAIPSTPLNVLDDIVLERGMSSLTMGHKTCISSSTVDESLILASLNMPLGGGNDTTTETNKPSHNFFGRKKNDTTTTTTKQNPQHTQQQPFSSLNNKTSLTSRFRLKKKLTTGSTKMTKTVGKLLSKGSNTTTPMEDSFTTLGSTLASSSEEEEAIIPAAPSCDDSDERFPELQSSRKAAFGKTVGKLLSRTSNTHTEDHMDPPGAGNSNILVPLDDMTVPELTSSSRKSRMAKLWQKTKQGTNIIGRSRGDMYHTLDPIGERASA